MQLEQLTLQGEHRWATPPHCFPVGVFRSLQYLYSHTLLALSSQEKQELPRGILYTALGCPYCSLGLGNSEKSTSNIHGGCVSVPGFGFWLLAIPSIKSAYPGDVCPEKWVKLTEPLSGCGGNMEKRFFSWVPISKHFSLGARDITTCKHCWPPYFFLQHALWKRDTFPIHHLTEWFFPFSSCQDRVQKHRVDCQPCAVNKTAWHGGEWVKAHSYSCAFSSNIAHWPAINTDLESPISIYQGSPPT